MTMRAARFADRVMRNLHQMGIRAIDDTSRIPGGKSRDRGLMSSLSGGRRFSPHFLIPRGYIPRGYKDVVIGLMMHPVLLGGVLRALEYADRFMVDVIICVPENTFDQTPGSVIEFAQARGIDVCTPSSLGGVLRVS